MRLSALVRCSASVAALALATSPAYAQSDQGDQPQEAQTSPADQAGLDEQPVEEVPEQEIVVTGFRESLRSQQNIRRNSDQIVDAIVAEDIGKLPDIAVSDTAARIPGIQVERSGGEANRVLLRGLDRFNYTTTYNGREIFTAETRSVALQDFPAGGISAIEAFKTSAADLVEPGIAGLINVRSRRPFDFSGLEVAGSVWANYPNQSRDFSGNAQLLLSNRWNIGDGEIGALINFSYNRLNFKDSIRRHGFFIADLAGARSPDWPEIQYNEGDRWRPSVNGAIQWRPNENVEIYFEGLWQGYREREKDRMFAQPLWNGGAATYENIVLDPGTNRIISGTVNNPAFPFEAWGFQGAGKRHTDTYQFALGGSWDAGPLRVTADIARTSSEFNLRTESIDYEINRNNYSVDFFTGTPGGPGPTYRIRGLNTSDPSIYNYRGFFEDYLTAKGDDWQARLDFQYEPGISFLPRVEWGLRFVDRNSSASGGSFYWNYTGRNCCGTRRPAGAPGVPITAVPLTYRLFEPGFHNRDAQRPFPVNWFAPDFDSVWDNLSAFRQFNINLTGVGSIDGPPDDPARAFDINERSYAAYGQLNYEFMAGPATIDGAVGLRVVTTEEDIQGTAFGTAGPQPVDFQTSYTDWLPNASLRVRFSPQWQARLAFTKTRTRPTFGQLNPALRLNAPPGCTPGVTDCVRTGSGGNPFLQPLESNNYDASLEYYFSRTGFATVSAFRRDMQGFIANRAFQFPDPDAETGLPLVITGPVNTREARLQGFEAQVSTFFDFLPGALSGLGIQANVTYIDAKADFIIFGDTNPNQAMLNLPIPDVSEWTYNIVGMYEQGGLTLRLAYNHRSSFPEADLAERDGFFTLQGRGNPIGRLDFSSSYAVNEKFTLFFDWTNILGDPFKSDIVRVNYPGGVPSTPEIFPLLVRYEESVLTSGIRFRF